MGINHTKEKEKQIIYPTVAPVDQTTGMRAIPCAILVESVNSPIMLLMTPTLPFNSPARQRLHKIIGKLQRNMLISYLMTRAV